MDSMFCLFCLWNYYRKINMKNFENMTIAELRKLHDQFLKQNPGFKTAFELLEEKENE